jgi:outer membrane protein TolC
MKHILIICLLFFSETALAQTDTLTLNIEEVLAMVKKYHPAVKQSNLDIEKSDADIQIARGAFNPIINNIISGKTFDNTTYYNYVNPNITVPTWYGIEVNAGLESLAGNRFDPSETVGRSSYLGVTVPLLKNLVMDKRRAFLKQASIFKDMAYTQQQVLVNNILWESANEYWQWVNAYEAFLLVQKNMDVSKKRFEMIKQTVANGERAAIDTVEALAQYQSFEYLKNETWLAFLNEGLALSVFLWQENNTPFTLPENVVPQRSWDNESNIKNFTLRLDELLQNAQQLHPELKIYNQKNTVLNIDKKLKFQEMLPKLDFKYNHLSKGYNVFGAGGFMFQNNYQYGLKLDMPIPFTAGRAEYKKAKIKLQENSLAQSQKALSIDLKIKNYYNDFITTGNQVSLQRSMLNNFKRLLQAEEVLFQNGESSLFLVNSRENKVLEAERKLVDLKTKYYKTIYTMQWSAGLLGR